LNRPLNPPLCENQKPYCHRSGLPMKCVSENEQEWAFACIGCGQMNIITRPEHRIKLRNEVNRERALNGMGMRGMR